MRRKGFTLVELLIVIVVIGILSSMMMLSSTEAVTSAKASNVISNLRNFKTAALAMYVDYYDIMDAGKHPKDGEGKKWDKAEAAEEADATANEILHKYINNGTSNAEDKEIKKYSLVTGAAPNGGNGYYVKYSGLDDVRIQEKIAGRALSVGLLQDVKEKDKGKTYEKSQSVYMFVTQYGSATATNP